MKMEQLSEMLKEMEAKRKKDMQEMEANRKADKDFMAKLNAYQAKMEASHKKLLSIMEADRQAERREPEEKMTSITRKQMMACPEKTEARLEEEEPTSLDRKPETAEQEVPLEDTEVMLIGEPKRKRRRDQNQ
jgi:t-SNARE complex subunit (syntaxin)